MTGPELGNCFVVAAGLVMDNPNYSLVHGLVTGTGSLTGTKYWHAWNETTHELEVEGFELSVALDVVIDQANGIDLMVPKALYYLAGEIEQTRFYTFEEAATLMLRTNHYGPWVDEDPKGGGSC